MRLNDHATHRGVFLRRSSDETARESMLTWERVQELCSMPLQELSPWTARRVLARLRSVGRWILRPEVIQRASMEAEELGVSSVPPATWTEAPRLGQMVGECWVMFVNNQAEAASLMRPCFVLPLCWYEDVPHSGVLPRGLIDLANQITIALKEERRVRDAAGACIPSRSADSNIAISAASRWIADQLGSSCPPA